MNEEGDWRLSVAIGHRTRKKPGMSLAPARCCATHALTTPDIDDLEGTFAASASAISSTLMPAVMPWLLYQLPEPVPSSL